MLKRLLGWFSLASLALVGAAGFFLTQTELGRWALGLVLVVGGTMAATGRTYETGTGTVTSIARTGARDSFISATVEVAYVDASGTSGSTRKQIVHHPPALETLKEGDEVKILICRSDPSIVKIPSLPSLELKRCEPPPAE